MKRSAPSDFEAPQARSAPSDFEAPQARMPRVATAVIATGWLGVRKVFESPDRDAVVAEAAKSPAARWAAAHMFGVNLPDAPAERPSEYRHDADCELELVDELHPFTPDDMCIENEERFSRTCKFGKPRGTPCASCAAMVGMPLAQYFRRHERFENWGDEAVELEHLDDWLADTAERWAVARRDPRIKVLCGPNVYYGVLTLELLALLTALENEDQHKDIPDLVAALYPGLTYWQIVEELFYCPRDCWAKTWTKVDDAWPEVRRNLANSLKEADSTGVLATIIVPEHPPKEVVTIADSDSDAE